MENIEKSRINVKSIRVAIVVCAIVISLILILYGVIVFLATRSIIPSPPQSVTSKEMLYSKISKGILISENTKLNNDDLNGAFEITRLSMNEGFQKQESNITINQFFGEIDENKINCYMNIKKGIFSYDIAFNAIIEYNYPDVVIEIKNIKVGLLNIPKNKFIKKANALKLPNNISIIDEYIVYDTTIFNESLIGFIDNNSAINNVEGFINDMFSLFGVQLEAGKLVDDFVNEHIEFKITSIEISNYAIIIKTDLFK